MEIRKLQLDLEKKRKGIINVYLIPETGDMNCGDVTINEFSDKYEFTVDFSKMDIFDLSSALYDFILSDYYDEMKRVFYNNYEFRFTKNDEYPTVFNRLKPIFKK